MTNESKRKVLLVDDEKFLLMVYKLAFEKQGWEVIACADGYSALGALQAGLDPDVILFDLTIPDSMSGYEFIETVNREKLARRSLKFALTNKAQDGEKARVAELGADAHLHKVDYTPSEVVQKVHEMLEAKRR